MSVNSSFSYTDPDVGQLHYVLYTITANVSFPLAEPQKIWNHELFDKDKPVLILITGWTTNIHSLDETIERFYAAYSSRVDFNFIVMDTGVYPDTLYSWSAFNTKGLGQEIGWGLKHLVEKV